MAPPADWEGCDGYGWPSAQVAARAGFGNSTGRGGPEDRHDRQDGAVLPRPPDDAEPTQKTARVSDPDRSVCNGVAGGRRAVAGRAAAAGQDAVRLASAATSRPVPRLEPADLRAAGAAVAGAVRTEPPGHVPSNPSRWRSRGVGLHPHERFGHHHRAAAVRSLGVPLRADLLELGVGERLSIGVVRGVVRWFTKRILGTRRRAAATPHGQPNGGGEQPVGDPRVSNSLSGFVDTLRRDWPAD